MAPPHDVITNEGRAELLAIDLDAFHGAFLCLPQGVAPMGAGYNTIDVAGASRRGIYVSNCPGKNAIAVAELTMALILTVVVSGVCGLALSRPAVSRAAVVSAPISAASAALGQPLAEAPEASPRAVPAERSDRRTL